MANRINTQKRTQAKSDDGVPATFTDPELAAEDRRLGEESKRLLRVVDALDKAALRASGPAKAKANRAFDAASVAQCDAYAAWERFRWQHGQPTPYPDVGFPVWLEELFLHGTAAVQA